MLGSTQPRLWTRPLRELSPETSYGYEVVDFARDVLGHPLDPWQEWAVIHAGELREDGLPRFRKVLILVSRQQGKTELAVVLTLYWLFVEQVNLVLGTSTKLNYAQESWEKVVKLAQGIPELADEIANVRRANGEVTLRLKNEGRYLIAASNAEGGRSLTIDRLILDELRQHYDYTAWDAAVPATNAVRDAQVWCLTNAGSDRSLVLNDLRDSGVRYIQTGEGDARFGMFEWSAPDGADPQDIEALAQATPNLGRRIDVDSLLGDAARAVAKGGEALSGFRTEMMCQRVKMLDPAIDPDHWELCAEDGDLSAVRHGVALGIDVSMDTQHATLVAAAKLPDGRIRIEPVKSWSGIGCTAVLREQLPALVARIKPVALGWLPAGPAASVAADLRSMVKGQAIRSDVTAVCMGFVDMVSSHEIAHAHDPLLDAHVAGTERLHQGDAFRFTRKGAGHCDATYAAAVAVHLVRTSPRVGPPRILVAQ
jgi:phage terminase large subunit-like protein